MARKRSQATADIPNKRIGRIKVDSKPIFDRCEKIIEKRAYIVKEMYSKTELVTPGMAKALLMTNPRNRSIKRSSVAKLEEDIKNGRWEVTHQGIALDENGVLIDGHHRLTAIVNTNTACMIYVTYNAVASAKLDNGTPRSDKDALYMAGTIEKGTIEYSIYTFPIITYAVFRKHGKKMVESLTSDAKHELYIKYKQYFDPVVNLANKFTKTGTKIRSSSVLYTMACALKDGISIDIVTDWFTILATGDFYVEGNDQKTKVGRSVLLFKRYTDVTTVGGLQSLTKEEMTRKAMSSLKHYANGEVVTKLYGSVVFNELLD